MGRHGSYQTRDVDGVPLTFLRQDPMSRIHDQALNSAIYLYKSKEAAESGLGGGGSGFLAGVPSAQLNRSHVYAVTNVHVVAKGYSVVRMTTSSGKTVVLPFLPGDWISHPDGDDVAVCFYGW